MLTPDEYREATAIIREACGSNPGYLSKLQGHGHLGPGLYTHDDFEKAMNITGLPQAKLVVAKPVAAKPIVAKASAAVTNAATSSNTADGSAVHAGHNKEVGPVRAFAVMRQTHEAIRDGLLRQKWRRRNGGGGRAERRSRMCPCTTYNYTRLTPMYASLTGLKDIEAANEALGAAGAAGDVGALQTAFEGLMRLVKLHMRQEDEVRHWADGGGSAMTADAAVSDKHSKALSCIDVGFFADLQLMFPLLNKFFDEIVTKEKLNDEHAADVYVFVRRPLFLFVLFHMCSTPLSLTFNEFPYVPQRGRARDSAAYRCGKLATVTC